MLAALVLAAGCAESNPGTTPPLDAFLFPVSVVHVDKVDAAGGNPGSPEVLYVVNSNFDLKYNRGTVLALDLTKLSDKLAEKYAVPLVELAPTRDPQAPRTDHVLIASFAGKAAPYTPAGAAAPSTLFVPTRENSELFAIRTDGVSLSCSTPGTQDCLQVGTDRVSDGIPLVTTPSGSSENETAQDPFAAAVLGDDVYVTHLRATSLPGGNFTSHAYLVHLNAARPTAAAPDFIPINTDATNAAEPSADIAAGQGMVFFTNGAATGAPPLRSVFSTGNATWAANSLRLLENFRIAEARGVAAVGNESEATSIPRLYVSTRGSPIGSGFDGLAILRPSKDTTVVGTTTTNSWTASELGWVALPAGASSIAVIERKDANGLRLPADLVAVSCTDSNSVAIYDDSVGSVVAIVPNIREPYGLAAATLGPASGSTSPGARIFVASFGGQEVAIIDIPDVTKPQGAQLAGRITGAVQQ